jgi:hypothetical protein
MNVCNSRNECIQRYGYVLLLEVHSATDVGAKQSSLVHVYRESFIVWR